MERTFLFVHGVSLLMMASASSAHYNFTISATHKFNGKLYPNDKFGTMAEGWMVNANGSSSSSSWSTIHGGPAKAAAVTKGLRSRRENVISIDLGGFFYRNVFYEHDGIESASKVFNMMGYDIAGVDPWDLYSCQGTCEIYASWVDSIARNVSFLCANLDWSQNPFLNKTRLAPWSVEVRSGRKIGFVGFTSSNIEELGGGDLPDTVHSIYAPAWSEKENKNNENNEWVGDPLAFAIHEMQTMHPDCNIICLVGPTIDSASHEWARDMFLTYPELDILISETDLVSYDMLARNDANGFFMGVPQAMRASMFNEHMATATFTFDDEGNLLAADGQLHHLDDDTNADREIWSYISSIYHNATESYRQIVGNSSIEVNGDQGTVAEEPTDGSTNHTSAKPGCRMGDCALGRIVNMANFAQCDTCEIAMVNGGGLRADIVPGPVSLAHLKAATPFDNYLVVVGLTGANIRELLDYAITTLPNWHLCGAVVPRQCAVDDCTTDACDVHGGYPQFLGLRWSYNILLGTVISVDVFDRNAGLWYSLEDDRIYQIITVDYLVGGGDGYGFLSDHDVSALSISQYDAFVELFRSTDTFEVFEGMPAPFAASEPALALYEQSSSDAYRACDLTSPLGISSATLPMRQTLCNALSSAVTVDDYEEPPFEVCVAVMVNSHFELVAVQHTLSSINNASSLLPFTELCSFIVMTDDVDKMGDWFVGASSSFASCASGRVPTTTTKVASILAPPSADAVDALNLFVTYDTAEPSLLEYPFVVTVSPNTDSFAAALETLLSHFEWSSVLLMYTDEYHVLVTRFEAISTHDITKLNMADSTVDAALDENPAQRIVVLFADAAETHAALSAISMNVELQSGFAYITLNEAGSLAMDGTLILSKPFNVSDYISDALWATAHGIHDLIEIGMSHSLPDDINTALADAALLHAAIASNKFVSAATNEQVEFLPSGLLASQRLQFLSVHDGVAARVGEWSMDAFSVSVELWPGSQNKQPTVGCPAGQYFHPELDCVECEAGTFAPDAGLRLSCTPCPVGTFASTGSIRCASCEYGYVAPERGLSSCSEIPLGTSWINGSSLRVNPGMWRPEDGQLGDVYECPIAEGCLGGSGHGAALCAEGFIGPLCSKCDSHFFLSWFVHFVFGFACTAPLH